MKVCYTAGPVKKLENCFSVSTNAVEIRIWFLTDDILRIRAGFDGDWDEASYSLTMTAWDSRTDELMKDCRKRVQTAAAELTDGDKQNRRQIQTNARCQQIRGGQCDKALNHAADYSSRDGGQNQQESKHTVVAAEHLPVLLSLLMLTGKVFL